MRFSAKTQLKWRQTIGRAMPILLSLLPPAYLLRFILLHMQNVPWTEELNDGVFDMVIAIKQGTFALRHLFYSKGGDFGVFTFAAIALNVVLTDWNILFELLLSFVLACTSYLILVRLFHQSQPQATLLALLPISLLIFSLHQDVNWLSGYFSEWHFGPFFFLLTLRTVTSKTDSWLALGRAIFYAFCATFSTGSGSLTWVLVGVTLPFLGHLHRKHYVIWALASLVAIGLYIGLGEPLAELPGGQPELSIFEWLVSRATYVILFLGAMFVSRIRLPGYAAAPLVLGSAAFAIGVAGLIFMLLNVVYLWPHEDGKRICATWLSVAGYGLGTGALVAVVRNYPLEHTVLAWYATPGLLFWVAFVALALITVWRVRAGVSGQRYRRVLVLGNVSVIILLAAMVVVQDSRLEATTYSGGDTTNLSAGIPLTEDCAVQYVQTLLVADACYPWLYAGEFPHIEKINYLAAYKLGIFAHTQPTLVLPTSYVFGDPVVVFTDSAWKSVHIRDWQLADVDETDMVFLFAQLPDDIFSPPYPLNTVIDLSTSGGSRQLDAFLNEADVVWSIQNLDGAGETVIGSDLLSGSYTGSAVDSGIQHGVVIIRHERR